MKKGDRIFITNHEKMPGSAFARVLREKGFNNFLLKTGSELDLTDRRNAELFFQKEKPDYVILTPVKSGGIQANIDRPAEFLHDNLAYLMNVIDLSMRHGVKKLFFISASCVYPAGSPQPIKEEYLLRGPFEPTNEAYAVANIAGIKMCEAYNSQYKTNFVSLIPANPYGVDDNFDPETSHVIPALVRRFYEAKKGNEKNVTVWGSGRPRRDFLYADDLVEGCLFAAGKDTLPHVINIGPGGGVSISELAEKLKEISGFRGTLTFDSSRPDGMPQKVLDPGIMNSLGWRPSKTLTEGLKETYSFYRQRRF